MSWKWSDTGPGLVWHSECGYHFTSWEKASWRSSGGGWQLTQGAGYVYAGVNHLPQWQEWITTQTQPTFEADPPGGDWVDVQSGESAGTRSAPASSNPQAHQFVVDPATGDTADWEWMQALEAATSGAHGLPLSDPVSQAHMWWAQGWRTYGAAESCDTQIARGEEGQAASKRRQLSPSALAEAMKTLSLAAPQSVGGASSPNGEKRELEPPFATASKEAKIARRSNSYPP